MPQRVVNIQLYGKPSERLILIACAKRFDCEFKYDESTGYCTLIGEADAPQEARDLYYRVIATAYKALAFAQANHKFDNIPNRTLVSGFMKGFCGPAVSIITGDTAFGYAATEIERAGLKAATKEVTWLEKN